MRNEMPLGQKRKGPTKLCTYIFVVGHFGSSTLTRPLLLSSMAPLDYRSVELRVGSYQVKQLTVVGVTVETFWSPPCEINLGSFALGYSSLSGIFDVRRLGRIACLAQTIAQQPSEMQEATCFNKFLVLHSFRVVCSSRR